MLAVLKPHYTPWERVPVLLREHGIHDLAVLLNEPVLSFFVLSDKAISPLSVWYNYRSVSWVKDKFMDLEAPFTLPCEVYRRRPIRLVSHVAPLKLWR